MRYLHITWAAGGLLFLLLVGPGCSSDLSDLVEPTSEFWDRSPCVAGVRQTPPCDPPPQAFVQRQSPGDCGMPAPAPESFPAPQPYREMPTPQPEVYAAAPQPQPEAWRPPPAAEPTPSPAPRPVARAPVRATQPSPQHAPASVEEMQVLGEVNRIRAQHSLRALRYHPRLWVAARDHSAEQARHGYMGHGSPDPARRQLAQRMRQASYHGRVFAEVVAWGYPDVRSLVEGWMHSPDHRRILLDGELTEAAFSRVGAYWTGNLGAPSRYTSLDVPRTRAGASALRQTSRDAGGFRRAPAPRASTFRRAPAPAPRAVQRKPQPVQPAPRPTPAPKPAPAPVQPLQLNPSTGFG